MGLDKIVVITLIIVSLIAILYLRRRSLEKD